MQGYEQRVENDAVALNRVRTEHIVLCWQMSLAPELRARLKQLDAAPDPAVLKGVNLALAQLQFDANSPMFDAPEIRPVKSLMAFAGVRALSLGPDDRTLVTNSGTDAPLSIWDLLTSDEQRLPQPKTDLCTRLLFSSDGKRLAALQSNTAHVPQAALQAPGVEAPRGSGTVLMWDYPELNCKEIWPVDRYSIFSMAWHSDERMIVVGMAGGFAAICDADTGRFLALTDGRGPNATSVGVSPDSKQLVVGYRDGMIRWYSLPAVDELLKSEKPLSLEKLDEAQEHSTFVDQIQFSRDSKFLVTCGFNAPVCVWDAATRKAVRRLAGRDPTISPDNKHLVTTGAGGTKLGRIFWDIETGKALARLVHGTGGTLPVFTSDGDFIITAGLQSYINVWHVKPYK